MFKKIGIIVVIIVFGSGTLRPINTFFLNKAFAQPTKSWAPDTAVRCGHYRMFMFDYPGAREALLRAMTVFPTHPDRPKMLYWIGVCYEKEKQHKVAIEYYRSFLANYPGHPWTDKVSRRLADAELIQL